MKYKRRTASYRLLSAVLLIAAVVTASLSVLPFKSLAADKTVHILVVYPEEADRISSDDSLAGVGRVLVSLGYMTDYMEAANAKGQDRKSVV